MFLHTGSTADGQVSPAPATEGQAMDDPDTTSNGSQEQRRGELFDLYKLSVEEYRFQVQLNWDRAKYLLGFNTAVIAAGTGLVKLGGKTADELLVGLFAVGLAAAALSTGAVYLQHIYYRSTRDRMLEIGQQLNIQHIAIATTPGARGERTTRILKLGRVQNILYILLALIAIVDLIGIIYTATR
jgi:hypothetical protein